MDTKTNSASEAIKRLRELLVWFLVIIGVLLILVSFLPLPADIQTIARGFGLSLAPAGVVTLVFARFAYRITEMLLREAVETTIRDRLEQDIINLDLTMESGLKEIATTVRKGVEQIGHDMQNFSPLFAAASKLGLENIHLTRGIALTNFAWFLDAEAQKAERGDQAHVWIISSSLKGFLEATSEYFDGRRMMERIARCNRCDFRVLMTDPKVADLRAKQERRAMGEIPEEVRMNIAYLKRIGVNRDSIRFYPGTPTVFAVATSNRMLLNPYPYQTEAFRCFSVIVQKTLNPDADIYHQYLHYHFEQPWQRAAPIPAEFWDDL